MKAHDLLVAGITVLTCGCSVLYQDNAPTIASLGTRPVTPEDTPLEVDESRAMSAYRNFLASDDNSRRASA